MITHVNGKCQVSVAGRRIKEEEAVCSHFLTVITSQCWLLIFIYKYDLLSLLDLNESNEELLH